MIEKEAWEKMQIGKLMSSPTIERLHGQNEVWQQISNQLKEAEEFESRITLKRGGEEGDTKGEK